MRLGLLHLNQIVGDLVGNAQRIAQRVRRVKELGGDLAITSELALLGYPPRDLLLSADFVRKSWEVLANLARELSAAPPVLGVLMPSPYSSVGSLEDSERLAKGLGIRLIVVPIESIMKAYDVALEEAFVGRQRDLTEENIQSRIRGELLMALSSKYGRML